MRKTQLIVNCYWSRFRQKTGSGQPISETGRSVMTSSVNAPTKGMNTYVATLAIQARSTPGIDGPLPQNRRPRFDGTLQDDLCHLILYRILFWDICVSSDNLVGVVIQEALEENDGRLHRSSTRELRLRPHEDIERLPGKPKRT